MNMNMTEKSAMIDWLEEEEGVGGDPDNIVQTLDTVDGFRAACREIERQWEKPSMFGRLTVLKNSQRCRGETRKDLYIFDRGDYRAVVVF